MRTTIDVASVLIEEAMKLSGMRKKKEVVTLALEELVRKKRMERLLGLAGKMDISDVTEDLEEAELGESSPNN